MYLYLRQTCLGGGVQENHTSDSVVLSEEGESATPVSDLNGLQSAIQNGSMNVKLTADIIITGLTDSLILPSGTLDLNGYKITIEKIGKAQGDFLPNITKSDNLPANANRIVVADGATVTIKDSVGTGKIEYIEDAGQTTYKVKSPIRVGSNSSASTSNLILDNVNIESTEYGIVVFTNGNLTVNGGSITADVSAISGNGLNSGCDITLNGGEYISEGKDSAAIYFPSTARLTIKNNATISGSTGIDIRAGTFDIKDSTITATGSTSTNCSAGDGSSGWGIGIAVFDHSSYASKSKIGVTIDNVTFNTCNTCNIFVGKHPGDGKSEDVSFSDIRSSPNHEINVTIKNIKFETKGLYINGANDVTITGCTFTNTSAPPIPTDDNDSNQFNDTNSFSNAIYLFKCNGNITIGGSDDDGNTISADASKPMRGIYLDHCGTSGKTLTIQNNTISDVNYNALQITNVNFSSITISNNKISDWDDDADSGSATPSDKGRAIRISASGTPTIAISGNDFSKDYFVGKDYDKSNIIKITDSNDMAITATTFSDNTANLKYTADPTSTDPYTDGLTVSSENFVAGSCTSNNIKINITVDKINFKTKGLIVDGINNDVLITGCSFDSISEELGNSLNGFPGTYVNAIFIKNCTGNVTIGGNDDNKNTISNVSGESFKCNPGRGILVDASGADGKKLIIDNNKISNTAYNAIQITKLKYPEISVSNNIIDNWDSDKDCVSEAQFEEEKVLQAGGRAIRLALSADTVSNISIKDNTFVMNYLSGTFSSNLGEEGGIGYDDGNILKATSCTPVFKDNVLKLEGITDYSGDKLFKFDKGKNSYLVTFNANGGYFTNDSSITNLYSLFVTAGGSAVVTEPSNPSRSGSYSFDGWYTAETGGEKWNFTTKTITENTTLYAKWTYTGGSGGSGGVPVTPPAPETPVIKEDEVKNDDGTTSSITETTTKKENSDGSKETTVEKKEEVKDESGNVKAVVEETSKVTENKDGSKETVVEKKEEVKDESGKTSSVVEETSKTVENKDGSKETVVEKKEEVKDESGKTSSVVEETSKVTENKDGSKETVIEKKEEVKDESGKTQSVVEEKHNEVVSSDGSLNKTSEKTVKDAEGKVLEEKTEIKIEDKSTGVSTSAEIKKDAEGNTASAIKTETSVETKDGKAEVNSEVLDAAIKQAEAAKKTAEEKGVKDAKPVIEIAAENSQDFTETQIAADDLSKLAEADVEVKIKTAAGEVNLPPEVSKNISSDKDEKVSLSFGEADKEKLSETQKKTVGEATAFEFNLKSGESEIHDLGGTAKVTVPYELKAGEDPQKITVYYIDDEGNIAAMNSVYDSATKSITFETSHFSYYFIAENSAVSDDNKKDSSNNTIYYAVAAVIIILIIIASAYYFIKKKQ